MYAVYTDCTLITIKLSLVKYLSKIRRQIIGYCPAVYFISEPTKKKCQLYIHKYYNTYLLLLLHLTSEMIAIPLPCNITEYKTFSYMPCYLYLGIKYFVAPHEFYSVGKGRKWLFWRRRLQIPGVGYTKIAKTLKLSCSMVAKTIQRFNRTGSPQNRPRHSGPKKLSECTCLASYLAVVFGK